MQLQRFFSFFFFLIIGVTFVASPSLDFAQAFSHSGKCHINKEMKEKMAKEVLLQSTSCQHKNHSGECRDCGIHCCQISIIGVVTDLAQPIQLVTQNVLFIYLGPTVKNFHKGLFRPPIT